MRKILIICLFIFIYIYNLPVLYAIENVSKESNIQIVDSNKPNIKIKSNDLTINTLNTKKIKSVQSNKIKNKKSKPGDISFDFYNTSLKTFGQFVAKLDKKTMIGEDLLKGNINMHTYKKMTLPQLKSFFRALLSTQTLGLIETNEYLQIIHMAGSIVQVYELKYLKAADLAKSLSEMYRMSFRVGNTPENIQITAVDDSNALMVLAPKNQQLEIEKSIKTLDLRTKQVFLNIKIVEVTKNSSFGFAASGGFKNNTNAIATNVPGATGAQTFGSAAVGPTAQYAYNSQDFTLNLDATEKIIDIKLLSQPKILALDNKKSTLKFGQKHSYVSSLTSLQSSTYPVGTTATVDIGLDIEITPRINKDKNVILTLSLTLNDIQSNFQYISDGTTNKIPVVGHRIVKNTSSVKSGQTLVIGGLLKNQKSVTKSSPPVFGDLPYIGWLFSKTSEQTEQVELIFIITPTVIENSKDTLSVTNSEINKLKNYDSVNKEAITQMLTGKKGKTDTVFSVFDYFSDKNYRKEQDFIPQPFEEQGNQ